MLRFSIDLYHELGRPSVYDMASALETISMSRVARNTLLCMRVGSVGISQN